MFGYLQQILNRVYTLQAPHSESSASQGNSLNQLVWKTLLHHILYHEILACPLNVLALVRTLGTFCYKLLPLFAHKTEEHVVISTASWPS